LGLEEDEDPEMVAYNKYRNARPAKQEDEDGEEDKKSWKIKDRIAVIYALGAIQSGEGDGQTIGSETTAKAIREARQDSNVKAIVLRVNSPGGSALASDVIWREAQLAKKDKPFIVSMGDYAASGGYYISAGADKIFANTSTVTGSIGVFGMIPNAKGFVNNKLGVTVDNVKTNENAEFITSSRALTDFEYRKLQQSVDKVYDVFLSRVAEGRGMSTAEVDAIGQGRVWSGQDAINIGLVDTLGGLEDAIEYAAIQANIEDYRIKELPKAEDPFKQFLKDFGANAKVNLLEEELGENYKYYQQLKEVKDIKGVQTRMPFFMEMQ
jgi:protease-4